MFYFANCYDGYQDLNAGVEDIEYIERCDFSTIRILIKVKNHF